MQLLGIIDELRLNEGFFGGASESGEPAGKISPPNKRELKILRDKNLSEHTRKFLLNMESFYDGYDVEPYTCEVAVSPKILKFFEAKKFFRSQKIEGKFKNGWRRVSYEISSDDMILMLAQRFFPHFMILSPHTARKKFDAQIREYLQNEKLEFE